MFLLMNSLFKLLRNWTLPISMLAGVLGYFLISSLPLSHDESKLTFFIISHYIQPVLLFLMLFLSFTKVTPHEMHPQRWHGIVLLCQTLGFVVFSVLAMLMNSIENRILCEGAMLCFICPTATASSVITGRLGGSVSDVTTYLLICNLMVALIAPPFLTMVEPHEGLSRLTSFFMIMGKVFPLLISPLICAWIVRFLLPKLHDSIRAITGLAFYLWAVGLALAILVTVRSIVESAIGMTYLIGLGIISLVACVLQFAIGKFVGSHYDKGTGQHINRITAGQAFGQKNTVFIIWLGLVFLDPVTSVVGGLYSVWHNIINSYQLYKVRKL